MTDEVIALIGIGVAALVVIAVTLVVSLRYFATIIRIMRRSEETRHSDQIELQFAIANGTTAISNATGAVAGEIRGAATKGEVHRGGIFE